MRILLVRPPVPRQTVGLKHLMVCEPLELEYVAAALPGHDVEILDLIVERGFQRRLRRFRPEIVATSAYVTGVDEVHRLCRTVKRVYPSCFTVVGGVHATVAPEDFVNEAVDCIVRTGDPGVLAQIAEALSKRRPLEDVPGLELLDSGRVTSSGQRSYLPDPDTLPLPRRDLVAHLQKRYFYLFHRPVATVKTTWGCWYRCRFCFTWHITSGRVFSRSPESIVAELQTIEADDVYIVDDMFLFKRDRLERLAELLRKHAVRKNFLCFGRADFIASNEDLVEAWAAVGLRAVLVGLEASTNDELEAMGKNSTVETNRYAVSVLRRHGIDPYASLIVQPDYTRADWERVWRFIDETGLYYLNISPLTPLPGTALWSECAGDLTVPRQAHALFDLVHCVLPTRMPLREFYRSLIRLNARAILDPRRASRLTLRTRPPVWSRSYLRMWIACVRIGAQMLTMHRHHDRFRRRRSPPSPAAARSGKGDTCRASQ